MFNVQAEDLQARVWLTNCHGLNVCVSQNPNAEILTHNVMLLGAGGLWEVIMT